MPKRSDKSLGSRCLSRDPANPAEGDLRIQNGRLPKTLEVFLSEFFREPRKVIASHAVRRKCRPGRLKPHRAFAGNLCGICPDCDRLIYRRVNLAKIDAVRGELEMRTHHDALEFPDGQIVLLTDLFEDQEATVLQLPAQPATAAEAAAQERVALVG